MITEEHLKHWITELQYAMNGIHNELQKDGLKDCDGIMINGSYFSFNYVKEKTDTIIRLLHCIEWDLRND